MSQKVMRRIFKKKNYVSPRSYITGFFLFFIIGLINLYQFPSVQESSPPHQQAIHKYETHEILSISKDQLETTHNLFYKIAAVSDSPILFAPNSNGLLRKGNNFRARMLGLAQVSEIKEYPKKYQSKIIKNVDLNNESVLSFSGEVWDWPGGARSGDRGVSWRIYTQPNPDIFVVIETSISPSEWTFIDFRLLSDAQKRRLGL